MTDKQLTSGAAVLGLAVSAAMSALLAYYGEPQSSWLWREIFKFNFCG